MGLTKRPSFAAIAAFLIFSTGSLVAAPRLRLSATTLGPISIAQGANGGTQSIEAGNIGDGVLTVTLSSSVSWIATAVGAQRSCITQQGTNCYPLQLTLNTASLPQGLSTGVVTVTAPNAVDSPQTITVTVQIGGALPKGIDVTMGPGKTADFPFYTNKYLDMTKTKTSASWLSVVVDGVGSYQFGVPYHIHLAPQSNMALGQYDATVTTAGSADPIDNKQIPVTLRVTDQPVAQVTVDKVRMKLAQGAPPQTTAVALTNLGIGALTVTDAQVTGADWVTAKPYASGAVLTFDPGSLAVGVYTASVTITSNSVTAVPPIPIEFTVVAKGAPAITFNGVVDNATFGASGDALTSGDVVVVLGDQLCFSPLTVGPAPPLATTVAGAQVLVNGLPAPMYYASYGQLAFEMPYGLPITQTASVQVVRDGQSSNTVAVKIATRAPRVLLIGGTSYGAITFPDGTLPLLPGTFPGLDTRAAHAGDTLIVYGIGMGATSPGVLAGAPAPSSEPLSRLTTTPTVNFFPDDGQTVRVTPSFAGLTPTYAGLYQVNVTVPSNAPKGIVNLTIGFPDAISNTVQLAIQ